MAARAKSKRAAAAAGARKPTPRFRRAAPAARREELIAATLRSIGRLGHAGLSVRHISAEAGVSIGLINHHFPSSSDLAAAAYETLAGSVQDSIRRRTEGGGSARERLRRFFQASFAPRVIDHGLFDVWLVFWSMVAHAPAIRAAHDRTYANYRALLQELLSALAAEGVAPAFRPRPAAIALSALLDGLWLELSLDRRTFKPRDAVALCEDWVTALCSGAMPGLRADRRPGPRSDRAAQTARRYTTVQQGGRGGRR